VTARFHGNSPRVIKESRERCCSARYHDTNLRRGKLRICPDTFHLEGSLPSCDHCRVFHGTAVHSTALTSLILYLEAYP
jgi:hypothetical protein